MNRIAAALALLILALGITAPAQARSWVFRVYLDGREIGRHSFTQQALGDEVRLVSEARFEVGFLFLTAYRYTHHAEERWRGECLVGLEARTETNGEREDVRMTADGTRWRVERTGGRDEHSGCLKTFAYWNPAILSEPQLLNAQTGELLPVKFTSLGTETLTVNGRPTVAQRLRLTAKKLSIDLWYAGDEWIALESATDGGRRLRYEKTQP